MKKILLQILAIISSAFSTFSQDLVTFCKAYGGGEADVFNGIAATSDGGYVLVGKTNIDGYADILISKINASGDLQWHKILGTPYIEEGKSIINVSDDEFYVCGNTINGAGQSRVILTKLNATGEIVWANEYGISTENFFKGNKIEEVQSGGVIIAGNTGPYSVTTSDGLLIRTTHTGYIVWSHCYNSGHHEVFEDVIEDHTGTFYAVGTITTSSTGDKNIYLVKIDKNGDPIWSKSIGGSGDDVGTNIVATDDGNYVLSGYTDSYGAGYYDYITMKFTPAGTILWSKTIGGSNNEYTKSLIQASDSSLIISGITGSNTTGFFWQIFVVKLDKNGHLKWGKRLGGTENENSNEIIESIDGGFYVVGDTESYGAGNKDAFIAKLDSNGDVCTNCNPSIGGTINTISPTVTNIICDKIISESTSLISLSENTGITSTHICSTEHTDNDDMNIKNRNSHIIYPNPNHGLFYINNEHNDIQKVIVTDIFGKIVYQSETIIQSELLINIEHLNSGIYYVTIITENRKSHFKILTL